jgi:WD40 repeat protein
VSGGRELVVCDPACPRDGTLLLSRYQTGIDALAVLPDGRIATALLDSPEVLVWDPADATAGPATLGRHKGGVNAMVVLPHGLLVTAGFGGRLLAWRPGEQPVGPTRLGRHKGGVAAMARLHDGRLATGGYDGRVLAWDPVERAGEPVEIGRHDAAVTAMCVLPDGRLVASDEDRLLMWHPRPRDAARSASGTGARDAHVRVVRVLPDGRVATGTREGRLLLWDPSNLNRGPVIRLRRRDRGSRVRHGCFLSLDVLSDGRLVSADGWFVWLWDPARPKSGPVILGSHEKSVMVVRALLDGRVASAGLDDCVLVWDPADGGLVSETFCGFAVFYAHGVPSGAVAAIEPLPDGRVAVGGGRLELWDDSSGERGRVVLGEREGAIAIAAALRDGRLATGDNDAVLLRHEGEITALRVLPDGRIVTADADNGVFLWDPDRPGAATARLECSALSLDVWPSGAGGEARLIIAHKGQGLSVCEIAPASR